jgi:Fe-S cluster assembly ATP-binding protein
MLKIKELTVIFGDQILLENINLEVNKGEIHAIMGPANSGKSSLAHSILGNPNFTFKTGSITYGNHTILNNSIEKRNLNGIFVSFQMPPEIDGVSNFELTTAMLGAHKNEKTPNEFEKEYKNLCKKLGLSSDHGHKLINNITMTLAECKKNEILQMAFLNPKLIILDEIDEDLEKEEIEFLARYIKDFLSNKSKAAIIITRSQEFLDILEPTHVHIMVDGAIREHGTTELYKRIVEDDHS